MPNQPKELEYRMQKVFSMYEHENTCRSPSAKDLPRKNPILSTTRPIPITHGVLRGNSVTHSHQDPSSPPPLTVCSRSSTTMVRI